jgi:release factor glutamine methyltransferase
MMVQEALLSAIAQLRGAGVDDPVRDARVLMAHAMQRPVSRLTLHLADTLDASAALRFSDAVSARSRRQPVSQIIGRRMFWGRDFLVTADVLDPRPETETLIAAALAQPFATILDLGTGSGCILLTLLLDRPASFGIGVDVSQAAISVATANRVGFGLAERADLRFGNWYDGLAQRFDLIVSNPPYIRADEMGGLAPEVRDHEPHIALTPGGDGLDAYRHITTGAMRHLHPGGRLILEIGPTQGAAVSGLFAEGGLTEIAVGQDMDGRDRIVQGRSPN